MIEQLPAIDEPKWLSHIDLDKFADAPLPLADILQDSLYYPASGYDADPVRYLAGNYVSFVYVDYGASEEELNEKLLDPEHGFAGYELIAQRSVKDRELDPYGWVQPPLLPEDDDTSLHESWLSQRFCLWSILQRCKDYPPSHGPHRFSLLYLCVDGVAAFRALYVNNRVAPGAVAIIQPGNTYSCGRPTDFRNPKENLAQLVLKNPAGKPEILIYGGLGRRNGYRKPCWPDYGEHLCFLNKSPKGSIGVWRLSQQRIAS